MSIITGVASDKLDGKMNSADMIGDVLNILRKGQQRDQQREGGSLQRFD